MFVFNFDFFYYTQENQAYCTIANRAVSIRQCSLSSLVMVHPSIAKATCNLKIMKRPSILITWAHSNAIGNGAYV